MRLRRVSLKLHRWGGLAAGAVVSVVSLSGAALVVAGAIESDRMAARWAVEAPADAEPVPPSALVDVARAAHPDLTPMMLEVRREDTRPATVRFRGGVTVAIDPWTGRIVGERHGEGAVSGRLTELHARLIAGEAGALVVLIVTGIVVCLVPLGLVLWWPRRGTLRRALAIELRRGFRRANYDLHNVLGFYTAALLLVLAATGVLLGAPGVRDLGVRAVARVFPAPASETRSPPADVAVPAPDGVRTLDAAFGHGRRLFPDAVWFRAFLPGGSSSTIRVLAAESADGDPTRYHTVRVGGDGAVRRIDRYEDAAPAERFDRLVTQLHTANGLGPVYRWLAVGVSVVGGTLPVTGFLIWLDRRRRARRRGARDPAAPAPRAEDRGD